MHDGLEWRALIAAASGGDRAALDELLRVTRVDARRYAARHCEPEDVDDAVQEALLIVARRLSSLRVAAAYAAWLLRVVQRECCCLARRRPAEEVHDDEALAQVPEREDDTELRQDLAEALQALPAHYREVLLLRDAEGLSPAEIALHTGLSLANVKSRLHRARALTREHLSRLYPHLAAKD